MVKILNMRTDSSEHSVQALIRLLLKEQSDQGLHCLPFHLHHLDTFYCIEKPNCSFDSAVIILRERVLILRSFMVHSSVLM